jgi:HSP20 family protein
MLTRSNGTWFAPFVGDPFVHMGELRRHMSRALEDFDPFPIHALAPRTVGPRFELSDTEDALRVRAELPGFRNEDLEVELEQNTLTIRGKREAKAPEGYAVHRRERGMMELARTFALPCRVDAEKVSAVLKDGVLELTLPKAREAQLKRIEVRSS